MDSLRPPFKFFISAIIVTLALFFVNFASAADLNLPKFTGNIIDGANIITEDSRRQIESEIAGIKSDTSVNLVVVTVDYLQGYDIADYGARLADAWGLGSGRLSNGVLLIIAPNERKIRIQADDQLNSTLTDSISRNIIKISIAPKFQTGEVNKGIIDGVSAIHSALTDSPYEGNDDQNTTAKSSDSKDSVAADKAKSSSGGNKGINIIWIIALVFIFLVIIVQSSGAYGYYPRRRYGRGTYIVPPVVYDDPVRGGRYDDFGGGSSGRW